MPFPRLTPLGSQLYSRRTLLAACVLALLAALFYAMQASASVGALARAPNGGAECPTEPVSGDISTNVIWGPAPCVVQVDDFLDVEEGATLTIQPGVTVQVIGGDFNQISIHGTLNAVGTASQKIRFTSDEARAGSWGGINLGNPGVNTPASATLQHVIMEYGRVDGLPNDGILTVDNATVNISNSDFRNGGSNGIAIDGDASGSISNTSFTGNGGAPILINTIGAENLALSGLSATGNLYNGVVYDHVTLSGDHTWGPIGIPYIIVDGFTVGEEGNLTIQPGVTVQAGLGVTDILGDPFTVIGSLTAHGTEAAPIRFTGVPGTGGTPTRWRGIGVSGSATPATVSFQHVIIEYAGDPQNEEVAALSLSDVNATVSDTTITNGGADGLVFDFGSASPITVSDTTISNNAGYPIRIAGGNVDPVLSNITTSGNGTEAIALDNFLPNGEHLLENIGLPYIVLDGGLSVGDGDTLTLQPGVEVQFPEEGSFNVGGNLFAVGTPSQPVRFTGTTEEPGWWRGIQVNESLTGSNIVVFQYCDIGYGGLDRPGEEIELDDGLLGLATSNALVTNCRIHDSAGPGIKVFTNAAPFIRRNRIENNAFGLFNRNGTAFPLTVDARNNWWGHESGPNHPTLNPDGQGNGVSDGVLYDPWLTDPNDTGTQARLRVDLAAPTRAQVGGVESYGLSYINDTNQTIQDAVLVLALPSYADYLDNSGGGIHWPQFRQVFWKLGTLEPGETGLVSLRVRFFSGLPTPLQDVAEAHLAGTNAGVNEFDVQPYLDYSPIVVETETELTEPQATAERQAHPDLEAMFAQLRSEGYVYGSASRFTYNQGDPMTLIVMLHAEQEAVAFVKQQGTDTLATIITPEFYVIRDIRDGVDGGIRVNLQTEAYERFGSYSTTGGFELFAPEDSSFAECMQNCITKLIPKHVVKNASKAASTVLKLGSCVAFSNGDLFSAPSCSSLYKKIPGVSEGIDLGKCNSDCQNNPKSHVCSEDLQLCGSYLGSWVGIDSIDTYKCMENGRYLLPTSIACPVLQNKCKMGPNGPYCTTCTEDAGEEEELLLGTLGPAGYVNALFTLQPGALPSAVLPGTPSAWTGENVLQLLERPWDFNVPVISQIEVANAAEDEAETTLALAAPAARSERPCCDVVTSKDPNAKYGPTGDVVPGQTITYRITYENVGEAEAFDVFIMDPLSEHFNDATLTLSDGGRFITTTRTLMWEVGTLAPRGQPGSEGEVTFSVQLKTGLPSGTVILNQAVVHFPTVPEVTPTNPVVSVVQPLAALGQEVETEAGDPLPIVLVGRDAANAPLTYTIVEGPIGGDITGTPPNVTYTPEANFVGVDRIRFTVSNGTSTSRIGDIEITVTPSSDDTTRPEVVETTPESDATIAGVSSTPAFTDTTGPLYAPSIRVRFSEPMDVSTLAGAVGITRGSTAVQFALAAEGIVTEAIINLREPLQDGATYTVTVGTGATDLMGNSLAAPYSFTFTVGDKVQDEYLLYMPLIQRPAQ